MTWKRRYHSTFGEIHPTYPGNYITVSIYVNTDDSVTDELVDLPAEEPLVIEWDNNSKEEPVSGSTATLRLISTSDQKFVHLMTSDPGTVKLEVTGATSIWHGLLDMRQCEEPYSTTEGYEVELTFTDFGELDRIQFDGAGVKNGEQLVSYCLNAGHLSFNRISYSISTTPEGFEGDASFTQFLIDCKNFYDESGDAMTVREVLEAILQPFALRMVLLGDVVRIYDLNSLYQHSSTSRIDWASTDQVLSFDKYVNKTKITFSTYCNADVINCEMDTQSKCSDDFQDENINLYEPSIYQDNPFYSLFPSRSDNDVRSGEPNTSYTIYILRHRTISTETYIFPGVSGYDDSECWPFHITPIGGGDEADGFCVSFRGNDRKWENGRNNTIQAPHIESPFSYPHDDDGQPILVMDDVYVQPLQGWVANKFKLRITMEMMIDPRYNPFETPVSGSSDEDAYNYARKHFNHCFVKMIIQMRDAQGNVTAQYSNARQMYDNYIALKDRYTQPFDIMTDVDMNTTYNNKKVAPRLLSSFLNTQGRWFAPDEWNENDEEGNPIAPYAYIDYYSFTNIDSECGTLGWQKNKQCCGSMVEVNPAFTKVDDGQYISYPYMGGYLHIEVMHGFRQWPNKYPWHPNIEGIPFTHNYRHVMFKLPTVEIVRAGIKKERAEYDDIEVRGVVNDSGVEELDIDTMCGSSTFDMPTSLGCVRDARTGRQLKKATRNGHTDTLENLLLSTIYSQYHGHKKILTGTVTNKIYDIGKFYDESDDDSVFMLTGAVYDVKSGTTQATFTELSEETYEREEDGNE